MKKVFALILAVVMAFSMCQIASAVSAQASASNTAVFLSEVSRTKKFYAHVTSHSYENRTDPANFDFYDDLAANKIDCNFKGKGINAIYDNGDVKCVFTYFLCYISASTKRVPLLGTAFLAVEAFQGVLKNFVDDPMLSGFNASITTVERRGETMTCEKYTGKLIRVSGTFYYNSKGELCEIVLTDTVGASIGFTMDKVGTTFDGDVFTVPALYFDLSLIWKIIALLLGMA